MSEINFKVISQSRKTFIDLQKPFAFQIYNSLHFYNPERKSEKKKNK